MATTPNYPHSTSGTSTLEAPGQETTKSRLQNVKHKAADLSRNTATKIDQNIDSAAGFLERSALRMRSRGSQPDSWTHNAAGRLESTASYLRTHHTNEIVSDFDRTVRKNPSASLAACFGMGFLIGMMLRRSR